jgi:hypothetical protein
VSQGAARSPHDLPPDQQPHRQVPARACTGRLAFAGEPRHPRPAGIDLAIAATYACDYGVYADDGRRLAPMDLRPLLDSVAARYDGCAPCETQHTKAVADDPALTTHLVGVALLSLSPDLGLAPVRLVFHHLDPAGAAIALTIRNRGLRPAVDVARAMSADQRRSVVGIALGQLLPLSWYHMSVSNHCPPGVVPSTAALGDHDVHKDLRAEGFAVPGGDGEQPVG